MELIALKTAWFAETTSLPPDTPLHDVEVAYFAAQAELPLETPLYDLKRAYYAAQTELSPAMPLYDLEVAFLADATGLPGTTPLYDLEVAYYSPSSLPPIAILEGGIDAGGDYVEVSYVVSVPCSGSFLFGEGYEHGGELTLTDGRMGRLDADLDPETEYPYTLRFWAEGYSDLVVSGSFETTALA